VARPLLLGVRGPARFAGRLRGCWNVPATRQFSRDPGHRRGRGVTGRWRAAAGRWGAGSVGVNPADQAGYRAWRSP